MNSVTRARLRRTKGVIFLRNIPTALKNLFKAECCRRGDSMQDVMEALIRFYNNDPRQIEDFLDLVKARKKKKDTFR